MLFKSQDHYASCVPDAEMHFPAFGPYTEGEKNRGSGQKSSFTFPLKFTSSPLPFLLTNPVVSSKTIPDSGARFSKVPIINGPAKLLPFTLKIEVSVVLHLT